MPRTLQTLQHAVELLELFDADQTEWTLSALARELRQPTSTVDEQLATLSATGLLTKVGRGRYRLGWRLLKLSSALYGALPWYAPAHALMERVAKASHLLAFLCVLDGSRVLCVARSVQGRHGPPVEGELDFELPPHATASGKLLWALSEKGWPEGAHRYTPETLTVAEWPTAAATIRKEGHAVSRDEWALGTSGLAVPLRDSTGQTVAALGVSLPTERLRTREPLLRLLHDAADEFS